MHARTVAEGIRWVGAIDWDRRLFDSLVPTPEGTSYNAWLVEGTEKVALLDTVDEPFAKDLLAHLKDVPRVDYVVAHHAEQDHSGALPAVLARFPEARLVATPKCLAMLKDLLPDLPADRGMPVEDGATLDLGGRTLEFLHMPWIHWPETMVSYLAQDRILFPCDLFGSHLASADLTVGRERLGDPLKRYYAEIMMPYRNFIARYLDRLARMDIAMICPSHGPVHDDPFYIMSVYREWTAAAPRSKVVVPYVSMHGSTRKMVERFLGALSGHGIPAVPCNLAVTDLGQLAMELVDAATLVLGTPAVLGGAHPLVVSAAYLADCLRPKLRHTAVIGSYSWGGKIPEQLDGLMSHLKVEALPPVLAKGVPGDAENEALEQLAATIALKHQGTGLV